MSKFSLEPVSDFSTWDSFVESSPQGTLFSLSPYLKNSGRKFECFRVLRGNELKAGISLIISDDGKSCELDDLVIYNGILFSNAAEKKPTKQRLERFEITEFLVNELTNRFARIEMALSFQFEDLRPFLWYNYHSDKADEKFRLDLRYTSLLDISELAKADQFSETRVFENLETLRQRNIREGSKSNAQVRKEKDIDLFLEHYSGLMASQGVNVSPRKLQRMGGLIENLLVFNLADMFWVINDRGEKIYSTVFGYDSKRAYYLFGAGSLEAQERYRGTLAFWFPLMEMARERQIRVVDFEGVNSPKRGWFKLSFGGTIIPYHHVSLIRGADKPRIREKILEDA